MMFSVTLIGSLALIVGVFIYTLIDARRGRAEVAAEQGNVTPHGENGLTSRCHSSLGRDLNTPDAALREDASVAWLESIPVLDHEPEGRR